MHIRECDGVGEILHTGGMTVAYSVSEEMEAIFLNISMCSVNDQFDRRIGREVAAKRLMEDGPLEIIPLSHPVSQAIRWWFISTYRYVLIQRSNKKWCSTFVPCEGDEEPYIETHTRLQDMPLSTDFELLPPDNG